MISVSRMVLVLSFCLMCLPSNSNGQSKNAASLPNEVPVALGMIGLNEISITKQKFLENMKSGLIDMSSVGGGSVTGFQLTVITHNLYEDSLGNPTIMQDIYTNFVTGPRFDKYLEDYFTNQLKVGDTIFLDKITVDKPQGKKLPGKPIKWAIVRKP